ncbi:hypothetical protein EOD41_15085 [Mucilaginibacter limnophilus]|uniref:Fibronectin type-III domain-containing protein n=1 Tax=Mucilaginibacter limnophilus TaxID=1932778 RepID=A0A437MQ57_9SPHI|nr:hypothetical protein [Mucilaginibacter limnophilus]RVT99767.1 hypothetical protein EOD41_15085 [Mucilaginibacter limnophilus]
MGDQYSNGVIKESEPEEINVPPSTPIVNSATVNGANITVDFTPLAGAPGCAIGYLDIANPNASVVFSGGDCTSPRVITVPALGKTYRVFVRSFINASPIDSNPIDVIVP